MKITTKHIFLDNFLLGILAGIAIAIAGLLNITMLSIDQKILGGILFSVGLLTVCYFGLHLYTGKIGYVLENKKIFLISLLIMYIGNIVGAVAFGYICRLCNIMNSPLADTIIKVSSKKVLDLGNGSGQNWLQMLGLGFMCGCCVFIGVDIYKKNKNWFIKIIAIVLAVAFFVITGMEHCVADMFYLAIGNIYATNFIGAFMGILIATIGNSVGAIILYLLVNNSTLRERI